VIGGIVGGIIGGGMIIAYLHWRRVEA